MQLQWATHTSQHAPSGTVIAGHGHVRSHTPTGRGFVHHAAIGHRSNWRSGNLGFGFRLEGNLAASRNAGFDGGCEGCRADTLDVIAAAGVALSSLAGYTTGTRSFGSGNDAAIFRNGFIVGDVDTGCLETGL